MSEYTYFDKLLFLGLNEQISIYVDWSQDPQVIGHYWFMIERAYLGSAYVIFQLKVLR